MTLAIPFNIETFDTLPSTQDLMRERLESGACVHGLVIRARAQTAGRGQRKRDWWSGPGGSYQTLAVHDATGVLKQSFAALAIGVGVAEVMPEYGIQLGIKWPNDLHYRGKKVAGILCEYAQQHLLVAVGMNVNNDVPEGATALKGLDTEAVSNAVLAGIQQGLELLVDPADLVKRFAVFDVLDGQFVTATLGTKTLQGVAKGVDTSGCLRMDTSEGERLLCHGQAERGQVRVQPQGV